MDLHPELSPWDDESPEQQKLLAAKDANEVLDHCDFLGRSPSHKVVHDGNWLAAAVKLGWVGPVVTLGVESPADPTNPPGILECGRLDTRLFRKGASWLDGRHRAHHEAIGWKVSNNAITFSEPLDNICLTVDLDAFAKGGNDGEGMNRRSKRDLVRSLAMPYTSGLAKGRSFREVYRAWLTKASFVLVAIATEIFIGYGKPNQRKRAESLLQSFWTILYGQVPHLIDLTV